MEARGYKPRAREELDCLPGVSIFGGFNIVDPWIEKALRMQCQAECLPNVTILKAALWLEKKHDEAPDYDTAAIISLHYLVLALRKQKKRRAILREHYISQALMWRREAINLLAQATSASL